MSSIVLLLSVLTGISTAYSGWMKDLKGTGLNLGDSGVKLFLDKDCDQIAGRSGLDQYSLRMGYSRLGVSLGKKDSKLDVGVYYQGDDNKAEGRGKKMGQLIIPIIMGLKASTVGSLMMAAVGGLVLKSLIFAKLALAASSLLGLYKLYGSKSSGGGHVQKTYHSQPAQFTNGDYKHLQPDIFNQITPSGYANYPAPLHSSASNQALQYTILDPSSAINTTGQVISLAPQDIVLHRRHEKLKHSYRNKK